MAGDCERLRKSGTCLDRFGAGNFHGEIVRTQSGNAISSRFNEISIEYSRSLFVPRLFSLFFSPSFVEMENPIRRASERQMCLPIQQKGSQFEESSERKKNPLKFAPELKMRLGNGLVRLSAKAAFVVRE